MPNDIDIGWVVLIIVGFVGFMWFVIILSILQAILDYFVKISDDKDD